MNRPTQRHGRRTFNKAALVLALGGCTSPTTDDAGTADDAPSPDALAPDTSAIRDAPAPDALETPDAPASPGSSYRWYPDLDMTRYPPHAASGAFGPQDPIVAPAAPVVLTSVTVTSFSELSAACAAGARTITLAASIDGAGSVIAADIEDVDIVVPPGLVMQRLFFGNDGQTSARLRIRGTTPGMLSGGQCHEVNFSGDWTDVIVDGVRWTGAGGLNVQAIGNYQSMDLLTVVNCLFECGGEGWLGTARRVVFCGNTMDIGTRELGSGEPAWVFRNAGHGYHILYKNLLKNRYFHPLRLHPADTDVRYWIDSNIVVNMTEGKIAIVDDAFGGSTGTALATWFTNNRFYVAGGGTPISIVDSIYVRIQNNTFYAVEDTSDASSSVGGAATDSVISGNTYDSYVADPAWNDPFAGVGADPTELDITP